MSEITKNSTISFQAKFGEIEKFSSQFSKAKAYVAYHGKNRNGTYISKETFENKLIPTLYGIPVVAEWKESVEDFGTHGGKLEITDEEIKYIETTKPYGFIDSSSNVRWENVAEENGVENEYLVADVFLWTSRYPEVQKVLDGNNNQSMEIEVFDVDFESNEDYATIIDGEFSALCILGEDVEPCFESARISQFNLDKESFKKEFSLMIKELKEEMQGSNFEGGENVTEEIKNTTAEEEVFEEEVVETKDNSTEENSDTEDTNFEEESKDEESGKEDESEEDFKSEEETKDESDENNEEFESDETDSGSEDEVEDEPSEDFEAKYQEIKEKYETLENEYSALNDELESLREYKANHESEIRKEQEEELFSAFSEKLSEKEIDEVRSNASEMTLEEVEKELYVLAGKKVVSFSFDKKKKKDSIVVPVEKETKSVIDLDRPYAHMFEEE